MSISIKSVFAICGAGFLALMVALIVSFSHISSNKVLNEHVHALMAAKANRLIAIVGHNLNSARYIADLSARRLSQGDLASSDHIEVERDLFRQVAFFPNFTGIYIGWPDGEFLYVKRAEGPINARFRTIKIRRSEDGFQSSRLWRDSAFKLVDKDVGINLDYDPRERPWYRTAVSAGETRWVDPYRFNISRTPGITVASPVYDEKEQLLHVVGIDLNIHVLSKEIANLDLGEGSLAFITTPEGELIASSRNAMKPLVAQSKSKLPTIYNAEIPVLRQALATLQQPLAAVKEKQSFFHAYQVQGQDYHLFLTRFSGNQPPWVVGLAIPDAPYVAFLTESRRTYLIAAFVVALGLGIAAMLLARSIIRPIQELSKTAQTIRHHGFGIEPRISSHYSEFQSLIMTLRKLLTALQEWDEKNRHLTNELSQLNAHLEEEVNARTNDLRQKNHELQILATTDALTHALNRRAFTENMAKEISRSVRYQRPASLLMMDIDFFKHFNDTYGHSVGDKVLKIFVEHCMEHLRKTDLFGRLGGEEFAAYLPETTSQRAAAVAERLRADLETRTIVVASHQLQLRVSIGVSEVRPNDDSDSLIKRADNALYNAKQTGRNRVSLAVGEEVGD